MGYKISQSLYPRGRHSAQFRAGRKRPRKTRLQGTTYRGGVFLFFREGEVARVDRLRFVRSRRFLLPTLLYLVCPKCTVGTLCLEIDGSLICYTFSNMIPIECNGCERDTLF